VTEATRYDLELPGCTPEPLISYLKALGILRLVSEQKESGARGWWKNDIFYLRASLDRDALVHFFLQEYQPTPIVAPWAGGSGFFEKGNQQKAVKAISESTVQRVHPYSKVIAKVQAIIKDEQIGEKPDSDEKPRLLQRLRRELPDEVVVWMDAAMVLQDDTQNYAPLFGTGGNDGRLDFTQNFMQRIVSLGLHKAEFESQSSRAWIENALFVTAAVLDRASVGQFSPGRMGGPNATQGMEGDSVDNPWEFVLAIEGALFFAGAAVRRFDSAKRSRAAFPFTVRAVAAGFASPAGKDRIESRGELWLPLWNRPASASELHYLFGEGRAEVSGRRVRNGVDFARAVAGLGVDRGITGFNRIGFLKRSGKAFLAMPLGRFDVVERSGTDLLREVDSWLDRFRRAANGKDVPPRFVSVMGRIDSAIFEFCKYGGESLLQEVLVALGAAERSLATAERFRDQQKLRPLTGLSSAWLSAADDGSREFVLARALASIHDPEEQIGPLRANLEPTDWRARNHNWATKGDAVVWNAANLTTNLSHVLERRLMDGARSGCARLPLASRFTVSLDTVAGFIIGETDDTRIEELIWGLMLLSNDGKDRSQLYESQDVPIPTAYALLKLLFLPRPLVIERAPGRKLLARLQRNNESGGIVIGHDPAIPILICGGRLGEACTIAMRRLRALGLDPIPQPIRGRGVRDDIWMELDHMGRAGFDPVRLAAALLIPIGDHAVNTLIRLVIHDDLIGQTTTARQASFEERHNDN
jgi:CRISPR-associated protein Csx17